MKGSIVKRQGKRGVSYLVRVEMPPDPTTGERRQRAKTYPTRKEAEAQLAKWLVEIERGTALEPTKTTVGELLDQWLDTVARFKVKPTTLEDYQATVKVHLKPALGSILVQKLTAAQVQAFYAVKLDGGTSPRTVQLCHLRLSQALDQALRWGMVSRNVCDAVTAPKVTYKRQDPWTIAEATTFLDKAKDDGLSPLWLVALTTGLRLGEVLGLRWRDLDLDARALHVWQTVSVHKSKVIIQDPKTAAARRTVKLPVETVDALKTHRTKQVAHRVLVGPLWQDNDLVFATAEGKPVHPSNIARSFARIVKAADLRRIRFHDLRHTHATWLLLDRQPVKVVSERLGHAKTSITLDLYAHVLPDDQDDAVDAISGMLFNKRA